MSTPGSPEHQDRHEHGDLAAGRDQHEIGRNVDAEAPMQVRGHGLSQRRYPRRGGIAMLAVAQRLDRGLDDMRRRFEIGLADAEVDDVAPVALQLGRPGEHRERVFLADPRKRGNQMQHVGPSPGSSLAQERARDKSYTPTVTPPPPLCMDRRDR